MNAAKIRNLTLNSNGFVPVGSDCAVCVETDGNFGVVCLDAGKIFCSTCVCVCVRAHAVYTRNCAMDGCNGI